MSHTYPIKKRDSNGNIVYYKESNGYEIWHERDSNGRLNHSKSYDGFEYWREYDSHGKLIRIKYVDGYEFWFDEKGNRTEDPVKILLLSQKLHSESPHLLSSP